MNTSKVRNCFSVLSVNLFCLIMVIGTSDFLYTFPVKCFYCFFNTRSSILYRCVTMHYKTLISNVVILDFAIFDLCFGSYWTLQWLLAMLFEK